MKVEELLFQNLFSIALKDWPEIIEFGDLQYYDTPDGDSAYSIENLKCIPIEIEKKYDHSFLKILLKNLNYSIYNFLGFLARDFYRINIQDLREKSIKTNFEHILEDIIKSHETESYWNDESIEVAREYFRVNYPEDHPILDKAIKN